jgi:hypothetical protein
MRRFVVLLIGFAVSLYVCLGAAGPATVPSALADTPYGFSNPTDITNPYFPLPPGTTFIYHGKKKGHPARNDVLVTHETKVVDGVTCVVVRDTNWVNGKLVELTLDYYAQDDHGNVWYFGEYATQYKHGKVIGHAGSWEAGVDGAQAGFIMEATPQVGDVYRQEFAPGVAEDTAEVLSVTASVKVPYGSFSGNVLLTKEFSPLDPGSVEHKYYAPHVGNLKSIDVQGGSDVLVLTDIEHKK